MNSPRFNPSAPSNLLSVDDARRTLLAAFSPLPPIELALRESRGLVLSEPVVAQQNLPPFDNSAMDGFACRSIDIAAASHESPVKLTVVASIQAGDAPGPTIGAGQAARIMTGAPVPGGGVVVVPIERIDPAEQQAQIIHIHHAYPAGWNVRLTGEDVRAGSTILERGMPIRPAEIALLAAIGRSHIHVHRRPTVAILSTGNEVTAPGTTPLPGRIWDSNLDQIVAMTEQAGGIALPLGIANDDEAAVRERLLAVRDADLIVTSGGVSSGDFDLVREVLRDDGKLEFWQVRIKPGRPLAFGRIGDVPLIGLPGNPVAVAVTFLQFVRPAILTLLGRHDLALPIVMAEMLDRVENNGRHRHFARVTLTREAGSVTARLAGPQGAGVLTTLSRADGLLVIPESMALVEPGTVLPVELLE